MTSRALKTIYRLRESCLEAWCNEPWRRRKRCRRRRHDKPFLFRHFDPFSSDLSVIVESLKKKEEAGGSSVRQR